MNRPVLPSVKKIKKPPLKFTIITSCIILFLILSFTLVEKNENVTALCNDGTYSISQERQGTCSHAGGVDKWLKK